MPFFADTRPDDDIPDPIPSNATLRVSPDQVTALRDRLTTVRDDVRDFLTAQRNNLILRPAGHDGVSRDAASTFAANANTAIEVASEFVRQLNATIDGLDRAAQQYRLVEDANTAALRSRGA